MESIYESHYESPKGFLWRIHWGMLKGILLESIAEFITETLYAFHNGFLQEF